MERARQSLLRTIPCTLYSLLSRCSFPEHISFVVHSKILVLCHSRRVHDELDKKRGGCVMLVGSMARAYLGTMGSGVSENPVMTMYWAKYHGSS